MDEWIKKSDVVKAFEDVLDCDFFHVSEETPRERIEAIPSADRPTWIPCSERLPDEAVEVLVVAYNGTMQVCSVTSYKGTLVWEDVYGYWHGIEAFDAWMPLPQPWKGADDERKDIQSADEQ